MYVPDWCRVVLEEAREAASMLSEAKAAFSEGGVVCIGSVHKPSGKLQAPRLAFSELACIADYVLVEADGARGLPLKAHAEGEPVIPACARRVVCVAGVDGVGVPVEQACHRPQRFAQLTGVSVHDAVTPEALAAALAAEHLHDALFINKVETAADWRTAERIAALVDTPVVAGSLWKGEFRCLR